MSSEQTWKLKMADGSIEEFVDIRRKVGNRIIRAYLLDNVLQLDRVRRIRASLRGPKDEFQDFDKFLVVEGKQDGDPFRILAESGVYQNLRIVGTDSERIRTMEPTDIIAVFTSALQKPEAFDTTLVLSEQSKVKSP